MAKYKIARFELILSNSNNVYFEGQTINGTICLTLNEPLRARSLTVSLSGDGCVIKWTNRSNTQTQVDVARRRRNVERYLDWIFCLWKEDVGHKNIPAGEHAFQFSCKLPRGIPSSFEGKHGRVRYVCKCSIDRPWRFDICCKTLFTVNKILDLNSLPEIKEPVSFQASKNLGFLRQRPLILTVNLNQTGFVPGQFIYINAEINNMTNKRIRATKAILVMTAVVTAKMRTRKQVENISEVIQDGVDPGQSSFWNLVPLAVPSVPPSRLEGCSIIDITYNIKFFILPSGECSLSIPITIGTIPLAAHNSRSAAPTVQDSPSLASAPFPEYPVSGPPSYAECVLGMADGREEDDNEHVYGKLTYTPTYASYPPLQKC